MNRRHSMMPGLISLLIVVPPFAAPALAGDSENASFTPREMAHCMMKRFRANHSESYRDAYKACKEQFDLTHTDRSETVMNETLPVERSK